MAMNNNKLCDDLNYYATNEKVLKVRQRLLALREKLVNNKMSVCEMGGHPRSISRDRVCSRVADKRPVTLKDSGSAKGEKVADHRRWTFGFLTNWCARIGVLALILAVLFENKDRLKSRCAIGNNYLVMEMTRPVTNCDICRETREVTILDNVTKTGYDRYAYAGRPVLVKRAIEDWPALRTFSFDFFKELYNRTKGAYDSVREECQFFPFKTDFISLEEVFNMPVSRARQMTSEEVTWYVGWSNCNPDIASVLRKHYARPHFLPDESESSAIDWIFMGYSGQGASMHLDYVQRPSWQAQISGRKRWHLVPPPECESICQPVEVDVETGDIILVDTNQWYHDTFIYPGEISITIGSEYD